MLFIVVPSAGRNHLRTSPGNMYLTPPGTLPILGTDGATNPAESALARLV